MSSDDGYILRQRKDGKIVLHHYCASALEYPPVALGGLEFDSIEEAIIAYNKIDGGDYPSEYGLVTRLPEKLKERETMESVQSVLSAELGVEKFIRQRFEIDAIRVTEENLEKVAKWCEGEVRTENGAKFIKVRVHNPQTEKQSKAYVGDWVLWAGRGYKVYLNSSFNRTFERDAPKISDAFTDPGYKVYPTSTAYWNGKKLEAAPISNVFENHEEDASGTISSSTNPGGTTSV